MNRRPSLLNRQEKTRKLHKLEGDVENRLFGKLLTPTGVYSNLDGQLRNGIVRQVHEDMRVFGKLKAVRKEGDPRVSSSSRSRRFDLIVGESDSVSCHRSL